MLALLLLGYIIFKELSYAITTNTPAPIVKEIVDTNYQEFIQPIPVKIPEPKIIVVNSSKDWLEDLSKAFGKLKVENEILSKINDSLYEKLNLYSDTLSDENLDIYYNSLVHGTLLNTDLKYNLKVPKTITKTQFVDKPIQKPSWLLQAQIGGNPHAFSNASLGLQFISKKGLSSSYHYNLIQKTHNIGIGYRFK